MSFHENSGLAAHFADDLSRVDAAEWNALVRSDDSPFLEWEWLELLERSGSVGGDTGWAPRHLLVRRNGRLAAAAPLYLKLHSEGEFVFDYIWADAARQLGLPYYPKLVGMSPFTPAAGYRFLVAEDEDWRMLTRTMLDMMEAYAKEQGAQGAAFNFVDAQWGEWAERHGYRRWMHQSFIWDNAGYGSFDDFLARFRSQTRKSIRRERRDLAAAGVEVKPVVGAQITPELMELMYQLYVKTNSKFGIWGCEYLSESFFAQMLDRFRDNLVLMAAWREGDDTAPVGMSLLVRKGGELWGRYWGCRREVPFLHFETCLYGPVIWAIEQGIRRFYPGIGGEHKMRRGFVSVAESSLHKLFHPALEALLKTYLPAVNNLEQDQIQAMNRQLPFRQRG
ncbi:MAG: GNAT family N-acetyltransferase [Desulfovibrionaceae bacterium]